MNPTDALAVLDCAASLARMTRKEHAEVLTAVDALAAVLMPRPVDDNKSVTSRD